MTSRRGFTLLQLLLAIAGIGIALAIVLLIGRAWGRMSTVSAVAFSPDAGAVAIGYSNGNIALADPATGRITVLVAAHTAEISALAFAPDGRAIATGAEDGMIALWDTRLRRLRSLPGPFRTVSALAFSPSGAMLADGSADGTVRLSETATGKLLHTWQHGTEVGSVTFAPDGKVLASLNAFGRGVRFWDTVTGKPASPLRGAAGSVFCVAYAPDGQSLATGGRGTVTVWDLTTGQAKLTLKPTADAMCTSLVYSPDASMLATGELYYVPADKMLNSRLRVWELSSGRELLAAESDTFEPVAFSSDGKSLWGRSTLPWETWRLWDMAGGRATDVLLGDAPPAEPLVLTFACWLWALAWARVAPDGSHRLQQLRSQLRSQDYRDRVRLSARPMCALFGALACAIITIAFALAMKWLVPRLPLEFTEPPGVLSRLLSLHFGRPLAAGVVGLAAGCLFALPWVVLLRRTRPCLAEAAILRAQARRRIAQIVAPLLLAYAAGAAVLLLAWTFEVSFFVAAMASWIAVALLYWEQAALYRAAQQRLAELKALKSDI